MPSFRLSYQPPYDWAVMHDFLAARLVEPLEWMENEAYGRTFRYNNTKGSFTAVHNATENAFDVEIEADNNEHLPEVVSNIRRILDLDRDIQVIDTVLKNALGRDFPFKEGTRLPGIWSPFEAGIRAILGQLISVKAAHRYCKQLVNELGESSGNTCFFPLPGDIAASDLAFFKMPQSKKDTLIRFSAYMADEHNDHNPESWTQLKGIGRWTVHYAQMRGLSLPDVYMIGDLGVKKMQQALPDDFSPDDAAPWRSYLTLQLWRQL